MIKATELKIGNKVLFNGNEKTINVIHKGSVSFEFYYKPTDNPSFPNDYKMVSIDKIEPIYITEERLLKCGFENRFDEYDKFYIGENFCISKNEEAFQFWVEDEINCNTIDVKVNYVHQLQNLYFALTGHELQCL